MFFFNLFLSILIISTFYLFLITYGFLSVKLLKRINIISEEEDNIFIYPLLGFSILSIIASYLYFLFNLKLNLILFIFLIIFIISFFFLNKKKLFRSFLRLLLLIAPIILLGLLFILEKGEQFYIFRGNYWDNMNYISQALLIRDFSFDQILSIKSTQNFFDNSYYQNGTGAIDVRPLTTFFLASIFKIQLLSFFYLNNLFKIFLLSLIFLSFYYLLIVINFKYKFFLSIVFVCSSWILYIYEIEALSHLNAIPFFLVTCALLLKSENNKIFINNFDATLFLLFSISFFLLYIELFSLFILVLIIYFFLRFKLLSLFKNNLLYLLILPFLFLLITLPSYFITYKALFVAIKLGTSSNDFWGYYSQFFFGRDNSFVNNDNIYLIKDIYKKSQDSLLIFKSLIRIFLENNFYFLPLNFIPSFFGLYYLTVSKFSNYYDVVLLFLILILNLYLIYITICNIKYILHNSSNLIILFKSIFIIFILFSIFLLLRSSYWSLTKLYTYFGPFFFLFFSIKVFGIKNSKFIQFNLIYLLLLIIFPFYKFSTNNYGIGYYDTFPSIINPKYKKEIIWSSLQNPLLDKCSKVIVDMKDPIINGYLSIKIIYFGYNYAGPFSYEYINIPEASSKSIACRVILQESKFKFIKNE